MIWSYLWPRVVHKLIVGYALRGICLVNLEWGYSHLILSHALIVLGAVPMLFKGHNVPLVCQFCVFKSLKINLSNQIISVLSSC